MFVHVRDTKLNHLAPAGNADNVPPNELGHVPNNILIARHICKGYALQFDLSYIYSIYFRYISSCLVVEEGVQVVAELQLMQFALRK